MSDNLRRILISVVVAAALVGLAVGFSGAQKPEELVQPGVDRIYPTPGDLDLRQVKIGAVLKAGFEGALTLDGAEIPEAEDSDISVRHSS